VENIIVEPNPNKQMIALSIGELAHISLSLSLFFSFDHVSQREKMFLRFSFPAIC